MTTIVKQSNFRLVFVSFSHCNNLNSTSTNHILQLPSSCFTKNNLKAQLVLLLFKNLKTLISIERRCCSFTVKSILVWEAGQRQNKRKTCHMKRNVLNLNTLASVNSTLQNQPEVQHLFKANAPWWGSLRYFKVPPEKEKEKSTQILKRKSSVINIHCCPPPKKRKSSSSSLASYTSLSCSWRSLVQLSHWWLFKPSDVITGAAVQIKHKSKNRWWTQYSLPTVNIMIMILIKKKILYQMPHVTTVAQSSHIRCKQWKRINGLLQINLINQLFRLKSEFL